MSLEEDVLSLDKVQGYSLRNSKIEYFDICMFFHGVIIDTP
jgi:hypothetical protein